MRSFIMYSLTKCFYGEHIKKDKIGRACSTHEMRNANKILTRKPCDGKRSVGRPSVH
jgi:hypothetical protein